MKRPLAARSNPRAVPFQRYHTWPPPFRINAVCTHETLLADLESLISALSILAVDSLRSLGTFLVEETDHADEQWPIPMFSLNFDSE